MYILVTTSTTLSGQSIPLLFIYKEKEDVEQKMEDLKVKYWEEMIEQIDGGAHEVYGDRKNGTDVILRKI